MSKHRYKVILNIHPICGSMFEELYERYQLSEYLPNQWEQIYGFTDAFLQCLKFDFTYEEVFNSEREEVWGKFLMQ